MVPRHRPLGRSAASEPPIGLFTGVFMAYRLPCRSRALSRSLAIVLSVAGVIATFRAEGGCTLTRTANNEVTLRFSPDCTSDTSLNDRVKTDLLGAVATLPPAGTPTGGDGGGSRRPKGGTSRNSPTSLSELSPSQKRLYALDQVRFDRDMWWRRTFTPFAYYGQSSR